MKHPGSQFGCYIKNNKPNFVLLETSKLVNKLLLHINQIKASLLETSKLVNLFSEHLNHLREDYLKHLGW